MEDVFGKTLRVNAYPFSLCHSRINSYVTRFIFFLKKK